MSRKREQRLRCRLRAALREQANIANLRALAAVASVAIRYVNEIDAPNLREPFSIANRRDDLVAIVHSFRASRGVRRFA